MHHGEFRDRRLVTVYDVECPWSRDDDLFLAVVVRHPAGSLSAWPPTCPTTRSTSR